MQYTLLKLTYLLSLCFFLLTSCVQQEIKKAFDRVNEGLVISNLTIEKRNDSLYNEIQKQTSEIKEQGQSARYSFNQYNMFITDLKDTMIARAGGRNGQIAFY